MRQGLDTDESTLALKVKVGGLGSGVGFRPLMRARLYVSRTDESAIS